MKIVFAASEMTPFAKTGGLADVIGILPQAIQHSGHEVAVFLPRYKSIDLQKWGFRPAFEKISVDVGSETQVARVYGLILQNGLQVFLIEHQEFFGRDGLYGTALGDYPDNDHRFVFFQRAVLETLKALKWQPDVIHCHDWQTGLIPVYLKTIYAREALLQKAKTVFTIHNLGFQGNFPPDSLAGTGLSWDQYRMERLEFYGKISFLKGGILDADLITVASARYAEEIQTREFGCGLEGVLGKRRTSLFGVMNGIDLREWNPESDPDIASPYGLKKIESRTGNKTFLQKENGFSVNASAPLVGLIAKLTDQKGLDILTAAMPALFNLGMQVVVLGTGDEKYHQVLREIAKRNRNKCSVHIVFDPKMAKRMYAGCDMILFPSYHEPGGLGQLVALRYGAVPVVRVVGGLADTIQEFDPESGEGNGFEFQDYTPEALVAAVGRAVRVYQNEEQWSALLKNAMQSDFSWPLVAKRYVQLYEKSKKRVGVIREE